MPASHRARPLELPAAEDPGILDRRKLAQLCQDWMVECRPGISSRLAGGLRSMSCDFEILDAGSMDPLPDEAVNMVVRTKARSGRLSVPEALARQMVASALGYSNSTETTLTDADLDLLQVPLEHLLSGLNRALGHSGSIRAGRVDREPPDNPTGTVVALLVALDVRGVSEIVELVVPWEGLREAIRSGRELRSGQGVPLETLERLPLAAEAVIGGVTMPLSAGSRLQVGDVVVLGDRPDQPVRLMIGAVQVGSGKLGSHENSWAVRVTDVAWRPHTDAGGSYTDEPGYA